MALKIYTVTVGGLPHTVQYEEGRQPDGAVPVERKQAPRPRNKQRTPRSKETPK